METTVAIFLRISVILCSIILGTGFVISLFDKPLSDQVLTAGIAALILLPVTRVAITFVLFVKNRDWIYVGITGFVFFVLALGFLLGKDY